MALNTMVRRELTSVRRLPSPFEHGTYNHNRPQQWFVAYDRYGGLSGVGEVGDFFGDFFKPITNIIQRPGRTFANLVRSAPRTLVAAGTGYATGNVSGAVIGSGLSLWGGAQRTEKLRLSVGSTLAQGVGYGIVGGAVANVASAINKASTTYSFKGDVILPDGRIVDAGTVNIPAPDFWSALKSSFGSTPIGSFLSTFGAPSSQAVLAATAVTGLAAGGTKGVSSGQTMVDQFAQGAGIDPALANQAYNLLGAGYDPNTVAQQTGMTPEQAALLYQMMQQQGAIGGSPGAIMSSRPITGQPQPVQAGFLDGIPTYVVVIGVLALVGGGVYYFARRKSK